MANNVSRFRRVRSISVSFEFDSSRNLLDIDGQRNGIYIDGSGKSLSYGRTYSYGSVLKDTGVFTDSFEFQRLPDEIKLKIFSYLNFKSLCNVMLVCKSWNSLLTKPFLWANIDFTEIPLCFNVRKQLHRDCTLLCYANYTRRVKHFINFLNQLKPTIRHLKFSFDIGDPSDGWRDTILNFLKTCRFKELASADLNWIETPAKKNFMTRQNSATWSNGEFRDLKTRRRLRQRYFIRLFDLFTAVATNVVELCLPFDWSEVSIETFSRLTKLKRLELKKYFFYRNVSQESFSRLMQLIPQVEKLVLELWAEGYGGYMAYQIQSDCIVEFDISQCRGIYFTQMDLPNLQTFKLSRNPIKWVFDLLDPNPDCLCMYHVLRAGTPHLTSLNGTTLDPSPVGWGDVPPSGVCDLNELLFQNCFCHVHYDPSANEIL